MNRWATAVLAILLASHALRAAEPGAQGKLSVSVCASPVRVFVAIYSEAGAVPRRLDWLACGRDATKLPAPENGSLTPESPHGTFVVADGVVDIDIEVPAKPRAVHYRGRRVPIGARAVALQGGPGALVWIEPVTRRLLTVKGKETTAPVLAREIARVSGARVDGIEHLGNAALNVDFSGIHLSEVLDVAGYGSEVLLLRAGDAHFAYSTPQEQRKLRGLQAAIDSARSKGDAVALEAALRRFLAIFKPPPSGPAVAVDDHGLELARLAEARDDHAAAERALRDRLAHIERVEGGPIGADYGTTLGELARLRVLGKDGSDAKKMLEQGLAMAERELGPADPRLTPMLEKLAFLRADAGQTAEAKVLFERAIEIHGTPTADNASALMLVLGGLANLYSAQERFEEAVPLLERNLALASETFGEGSLTWVREAEQLAMVLVWNDSLLRAGQLLQRTTAVRGPDPASQQQRMLDAIRALGPHFAGGKPPGAGSLDALRATLARGLPDGTRYEISSILERRAKRQYRDAPAGKAWRVTCEAQAEVVTSSGAPGHAREVAIERCLRSASGADRS